MPPRVGPVDVFVVDRSAKRFVISETKDIDGATLPKDIRSQTPIYWRGPQGEW